MLLSVRLAGRLPRSPLGLQRLAAPARQRCVFTTSSALWSQQQQKLSNEYAETKGTSPGHFLGNDDPILTECQVDPKEITRDIPGHG